MNNTINHYEQYFNRRNIAGLNSTKGFFSKITLCDTIILSLVMQTFYYPYITNRRVDKLSNYHLI